MNDIGTAKENFIKGLTCLEKRDFSNAERFFVRTLELAPRSVPTLSNLAIAQYEQRKIIEASRTAKKVIEIDPTNIDAYSMLADCQKDQKKYDEALTTCETIIEIDSTIAEAHCNRGYVLNKIGKHQEAVASTDRALAIRPKFADAFLNRGNSLLKLKRYDEALGAYDKALSLKPDLANAWLGRGNAFCELKRRDEAFSAYDKALALESDLAEAWLGRGNVFCELKRYGEASSAYDNALALKPDLASAWLGRGNVFTELKSYDEALSAYDKALALESDLAEVWVGRGYIFSERKHYDEAFSAYNKALALDPHSANAWLGCGNVFNELKRYEEAFRAYDKALTLKPDLAGLEGARLDCKMHVCDWSNFRAECEHLISSVKSQIASAQPFTSLATFSAPQDQLRCAELWCANTCPVSNKAIWQGERYSHDRVRVAYLSADFREHAVSYLLAGVLEQHDHKRFETFAISFGPDDRSSMRTRVEAAVEQFVDVRNKRDADVARLLRTLEIDIAVDLMGYTKESRNKILSHRAVPIQVNYLGYPGTMGANYIDYIIADSILIPAPQQINYSEKIVYLPNSYQANDAKRAIADRVFTRAELRLPQNDFVFCCFNNNYKISPEVFDCWMQILKHVEGSVLWLLEPNASAISNLRNEANARGVDGERLVFAERMSLPDHLARHRLADLFLDTRPYNAHTTASDALWAGLPVLTQIGESFAGRVAASLLTAIGLPELITSTEQGYVALAIQLATSQEKLAALKRKLASNRSTTSFFDTQRFTRHIEAAYTEMYKRYLTNLPPDHIHVPQ